MDFINDFKEQVINLFKKNGISFAENCDAHWLAIKYLNTINKMISIKSRKVLVSDKLINLTIDKRYKDIMEEIKRKFEKGENINPYLSKQIFNAEFTDFLLDDWGIHHLHLSNSKSQEKKFFLDRSDYLLFVKVFEDSVYFIDIMHHNLRKVFAKKELIETLDKNWHELLERYEIKEVTSLSPKIESDDDIDKLRKAGVNIMYEINGRIYMPMGGGLTTARTNINHTRNADYLFKAIRNIEEDIQKNMENIKEQFVNELNYEGDLNFKLLLADNGFLIKETNSGVEFPIDL